MTGGAARPRVVVVGDAEQALRRLGRWQHIDARADVVVHHQPLRGDALIDALKPADILILVRDRTPLGVEELSQLPQLKYLIFTGTRNTTLDQSALAARGIPVSHTEWGPSKDSTCEMTWALILASTRRLEQQTALLRQGHWREAGPAPLAGVLKGQTLGLIGLGEIGMRVARVAQAFGMKVVAWSPHMTSVRAAQHCATAVELEALLQMADVVSLHLVPSGHTRQLMNAQRLALMRPGSLLVNTSRSSLVDRSALVDALQAGQPGFAALDVFDEEPLPADDLLRTLPNVLLTPHLGFVTEPVFQRFADGVVECVEAWLDKDPLPRLLT